MLNLTFDAIFDGAPVKNVRPNVAVSLAVTCIRNNLSLIRSLSPSCRKIDRAQVFLVGQFFETFFKLSTSRRCPRENCVVQSYFFLNYFYVDTFLKSSRWKHTAANISERIIQDEYELTFRP